MLSHILNPDWDDKYKHVWTKRNFLEEIATCKSLFMPALHLKQALFFALLVASFIHFN